MYLYMYIYIYIIAFVCVYMFLVFHPLNVCLQLQAKRIYSYTLTLWIRVAKSKVLLQTRNSKPTRRGNEVHIEVNIMGFQPRSIQTFTYLGGFALGFCLRPVQETIKVSCKEDGPRHDTKSCT